MTIHQTHDPKNIDITRLEKKKGNLNLILDMHRVTEMEVYVRPLRALEVVQCVPFVLHVEHHGGGDEDLNDYSVVFEEYTVAGNRNINAYSIIR